MAVRFASIHNPTHNQAGTPPSAAIDDFSGPSKLHPIERAPALELAPVDSPIGPPAPPTSPLADLQNAAPRDSRFRTRAHFSGQKRRASDYDGPLRRATDRRPKPTYSGPLRRVSDKQGPANQPPSHDTSERRISDRRSPGFQEVQAQKIPIPKRQQTQQVVEEARQHRVVTPDASFLSTGLDLLKQPLQPGCPCDVPSASITLDAAGLAPQSVPAS